MKLSRIMMMLLLAGLLLVSGCSTTGTIENSDEGAQSGQGTAGSGSGARTSGIQQGAGWSGSPLEDPNSPLYEKTIYFDFDESFIRQEFVPVLRAHAEYLVNNPGVHLTIEGHCDERGSREYNIALGERRANAVKRFLEAEGVSPVQLETVSYGEERPVDPGHNEAAWAMNRRAQLVY